MRESKVCDLEMSRHNGANNGIHTLDLRDEWYSTCPTQKRLECATLGNTVVVVGRVVLGVQPHSRNLGESRREIELVSKETLVLGLRQRET